MSHHRGNGHLCVPIQQSPPNGFRVKCPVRGFVLARGLATEMRLCGLLREYPRNNTWKFCQMGLDVSPGCAPLRELGPCGRR